MRGMIVYQSMDYLKTEARWSLVLNEHGDLHFFFFFNFGAQFIPFILGKLKKKLFEGKIR